MLRLAIQCSVSACICYYGMNYFGLPEVYVGVLSSVLVIEPSFGNTFYQAKGRILSTFIGSLIGLLFIVLMPWELGSLISLALSMFIINGIASLRPEWRYGVVAVAALAMSSENDLLTTSLDRLLSIGIGAAIGILVSLVVWRSNSEDRAHRFMRGALKNASKRFDIAVSNTRDSDNEDASNWADKFYKNLNLARKYANKIAFNKKEDVLKKIDLIERLYNSIIIIHRVANHSEENISDGESGIEKDSEKIQEYVSGILEKLSKNEVVEEDYQNEITETVERIKEDIQLNPDNKQLTILRNSFVFGLTEIETNITELCDLWEC